MGGGGPGGSGWMAELSSMSSCSGLIRAVLLPLQRVVPSKGTAQHTKCTEALPFKGDEWLVLLVLCF